MTLRLPLTATVDVIPSRADFPPKRLKTRPSAPANWTCDFCSVRTSAKTAYDDSEIRPVTKTTRLRILGILQLGTFILLEGRQGHGRAGPCGPARMLESRKTDSR